MKKKNVVKKPQQNNSVMRNIEKAHICIEHDCDQLDKLYRKALVETNKNALAAKKSLAKAQVQAKKAKRHRKESPKGYLKALAEIKVLEKQSSILKTELAGITAYYTQFNAKKKAMDKFEKEWNKKKAAKPKKRKAKTASKRMETDQAREALMTE